MSAREWVEFDGKPGTSATDITCSIVVLLMVAVAIFAVFLVTARALDAATDPAVPACEQAIAEGYYTAELYGQCLNDYQGAHG